MLPETRLRSLYSDFRELAVINVEGYEANIRQWKEYLTKTVLYDQIIVQADTLLSELARPEYGEPKSIDVVIDEMVKDGALMPMKHYQNRNESKLISLVKWGISKTIMDLSWKSRSNEGKRYLKPTSYVNMSWFKSHEEVVLKQLKTNILDTANASVDYLFTKKLFYKVCHFSDLTNDWDSYEIILDHLCDKSHIIMGQDDTIKVVSPLADHSFGTELLEITEDDACVAKVNEFIYTAESEIKSGHKVVDLMTTRLSKAISLGLSQEVKRTILRLKKRSEKNLEQAYTSLETLKKVQEEIAKASQNAVMVNLLKQGNTALKKINSKLLDENSITDILDEFQENSEKQERIQQLLSGEKKQDDESLENELLKLEEEISLDNSKEPKSLPELYEDKDHKSTEDLIKRLESLKVSSEDAAITEKNGDAKKATEKESNDPLPA